MRKERDVYTTDGTTVNCGDGYMGIFSTVSLLNDKIKEIEKLQADLALAKKGLEWMVNHTQQSASRRKAVSLLKQLDKK